MNERTAVFIDGANLYATCKAMGFDIDFRKLRNVLASRGRLIRIFYYTAIIPDEEFSSIRRLIDWLDYNGYNVVTKSTKTFYDNEGRKKIKGNMDVELAIDALELAPYIDHMILFSGDGDFRSVVAAIQRKGVRVTVASSLEVNPPMIADELRRQADDFLEIFTLRSAIERSHEMSRSNEDENEEDWQERIPATVAPRVV